MLGLCGEGGGEGRGGEARTQQTASGASRRARSRQDQEPGFSRRCPDFEKWVRFVSLVVFLLLSCAFVFFSLVCIKFYFFDILIPVQL